MRSRQIVRLLIVASAGASSCGTLLVDDARPEPPARTLTDAGTAADALGPDGDGDRPRRCAAAAPFGNKRAVRVEGDYSIEAARFRPDRSGAFVALCVPDASTASCDLFASTVAPDGSLVTHLEIGRVNAAGAYDSYPTITADGRHLLFSSRRTTDFAIHVATADGGRFDDPSAPALAPPVGTTWANEPYVLPSGKALYFAAKASGAQPWRLFVRRGPIDESLAAAHAIVELDDGSSNVAPVVTDDELEIVFASDRPHPAGGASLDVWRAEAATPNGKFGAPVLVEAASGSGIDYPVWISSDACDLYVIHKDAPTAKATLYLLSR